MITFINVFISLYNIFFIELAIKFIKTIDILSIVNTIKIDLRMKNP